MYFGFVRVFENIGVKGIIECVFERLLQVFTFFSRKRYCEQDIFDNRGNKIDFPKVISYFFGQIACQDEQEQCTWEVNDKGHDEPEMRLLVNENYLWLVHLVEQVEYWIGNDKNGFDWSREWIKGIILYRKKVINGKYEENGAWDEYNASEYAIYDHRVQYVGEHAVFH